MEYLIYCDESVKRGNLFSNFYGGALVKSIDLNEVVSRLNQYKNEHNINGEMKWTKVTAQYLEKYIGIMDVFFDLTDFRKKSPILKECAGRSPMSRWEMNFGWL